MNTEEAAQYLQSTRQNIKALVDEHVLSRLARERGGSKIPSTQVRDFGLRFVSLESVARDAKSNRWAVLATVKKRGLPILFLGRRRPFLPKESALKVLESARHAAQV